MSWEIRLWIYNKKKALLEMRARAIRIEKNSSKLKINKLNFKSVEGLEEESWRNFQESRIKRKVD